MSEKARELADEIVKVRDANTAIEQIDQAVAPLVEALELVEEHYGEDSDVFWKVREALKQWRE